MDVSIVVPVHNVAPYIEKCVRSVMAQTFAGSVECLLVDDFSPDDSIARAEKLIAEYGGPVEFRILRPAVHGLAIARNTGTQAATGEFLMYLDSDDALTPDCIETLMAPMRRDPTLEMVMGDYTFVSDGPKTPEKQEALAEEDITARERIVKFCHWGNYLVCWNKLIRRSFLVEHGILFREGILAEDNLWAFHLTRHLQHMYTLPDVTYLYCVHPNSMMTGTDPSVRSHYLGLIFAQIASELAESGDPYGEAGAFVDRICMQLIRFPKIHAYDEAIGIFKRSLRERGERRRLAYLSVMDALSKSRVGRWLLPWFWKLVGLIRFGTSKE